MMENIRLGIFMIVTIVWVILMNIHETRIYGMILFGSMFIISGLYLLQDRIIFDSSEKANVSGTLIKLEYYEDAEGNSSYTPHYKYEYQNKTYNHKSHFSAFWYKKKKHIGDIVTIMVCVHHPNESKIKNMKYTLLEYFVGVFMIVIGLVFVLYGNRIIQ